MKIIIANDYEDMSRKAANYLSAQVIMKPDAVLGLATGETPIGAYKQLVEWYNKFHEKVLYRMRHNKYDSLRKSYNKVIKNKVNDVKQGLYQTIYLTLTIMAEDVADAKAHLVLWRVP